MIVIEGPDGAGKTTLVKHLSEKFDLQVGARGVTNRDFLYKVTRQDTHRALSAAVLAQEPPYIWDRLFVSEFVYADIVERPCEFNSMERDIVVDVMNAIGCPVILCLPPFDVVETNVSQAKQMKGVNENLRMIYDRYVGGGLPWPDNTIWYDYTGTNNDHDVGYATLADVEEEVEGYIEHRHGREAWA